MEHWMYPVESELSWPEALLLAQALSHSTMEMQAIIPSAHILSARQDP